MKHLSKLALLVVALFTGLTAYSQTLTLTLGDMLENMDDPEWVVQLYNGDVSIAEGTYVQIKMGTWHTDVMKIYMNGEVVYTKPTGAQYSGGYSFTAGKNCKILGGYQNMFDWGTNPNIRITQDVAVAVTGVTLSQTTATLTVGGTALELTPTVAPEGATDKKVKWSVTQTGSFVALYTDEACTQAVGTEAIAAAKVYVKPLAAGQATVTVTTNDGAKTATCAVTVAEPTYNVTFKDGTEDVGNWTIDPTSAKKGQPVTVKYNGTKKVKSVKAIKK